jgi:hypothetical protein
MLTVAASVEVQLSAEVSPYSMLAGLAEILTVGSGGVATVTVTVSVAVPPGPSAVMVYVVVSVGDTSTDPPAGGVTSPTPWSILTVVASVEVQLSAEVSPYSMLAGLAEIVTVGSGGGVVTVTVAVSVAVPPGPSAVMVYVVVTGGDTTSVPVWSTGPIPWSMVTLIVASVEVQLSVEVSPYSMLAGLADIVTVGSGGGATVTVTVSVAVPPGPSAVMVYVVVSVGDTSTEPPAGGVTLPTPSSMLTVVAYVEVQLSVELAP